MKSAILLLTAASLATADDGFANWWPHFLAAVAKNDVNSIVDHAKFPMPWENGPVREIKSREEFATRFDSYFTADMKRAVAREKPVRVPEGYMITWKARGNEYSLYFHAVGKTFAVGALSEGPP